MLDNDRETLIEQLIVNLSITREQAIEMLRISNLTKENK